MRARSASGQFIVERFDLLDMRRHAREGFASDIPPDAFEFSAVKIEFPEAGKSGRRIARLHDEPVNSVLHALFRRSQPRNDWYDACLPGLGQGQQERLRPNRKMERDVTPSQEG